MNNCGHFWAEADYLPLDVAVDYWCDLGDTDCKTAKRYAIIGACERGEIEYIRRDGKDFPDPVHELVSRGLLLIHRERFLEWTEKFKGKRPDIPLNTREEATYLNIIAVLLEVLDGSSPGLKSRQCDFPSETALIDYIADKYQGYKGLSKRTLQDKFAKAKRSLKEG